MFRTASLVVLALLAACSPESGTPDARAEAVLPEPSTPDLAAPEQGTFVVLKGTDTLYTERFTRTADRLETEITAPGGERVTQTLTLNPDATVSRMELRLFPSGAPDGAAPSQQMIVTLRGDTAIAQVTKGDSTGTERVATQPNAIPNPVSESAVVVEQILRRARAIGGQQVEVPILNEDGETSPVTVTFTGSNQARIQGKTSDVRVTTDATGRLLSAQLPGQNITIQRAMTATP